MISFHQIDAFLSQQSIFHNEEVNHNDTLHHIDQYHQNDEFLLQWRISSQ